jgi:hypothetical protein
VGGLVFVGDNYHKNREAVGGRSISQLQKLPRKKKSESRQPEILDAYCCTRRRFLLGLKSHARPIYHWAQPAAPLYAGDGRCARAFRKYSETRANLHCALLLFALLGLLYLAGGLKINC